MNTSKIDFPFPTCYEGMMQAINDKSLSLLCATKWKIQCQISNKYCIIDMFIYRSMKTSLISLATFNESFFFLNYMLSSEVFHVMFIFMSFAHQTRKRRKKNDDSPLFY